ncbi:hypothetical protein [Massilia sp.]|uniref:hypothetical protein n=1 Tax=Massilia sp. TaxID=1882437 RepID=UPI00289C9F21|nr:hypothetical protein [Massilia sp.]
MLFPPAMTLPLTLILILLLAPPAQAARRVGEALVREGANGVPCFTISQREEQRGGVPDFQSVTVSEAGGKLMWRMAMPRERTFPVMNSMCIPYGGRVQALPQTPAAALAPGKAYLVQIEARPGRKASMPLRYQARFCLVKKPGGMSGLCPVPGEALATAR